jgi:hypothetical protein
MPSATKPTAWQRIRRFQGERFARWRRQAPAWTPQDMSLQALLAEGGDDVLGQSKALLAYFWAGQQHYVDRHGTLADYPGWPSIYGARNDAIEGVSRLLPLWAAALDSPLLAPADVEGMAEHLQRALRQGSDPGHPGYWGDIGERSTLICEGADIALALWLARRSVWPLLDAGMQRQLLSWLGKAVGRQTADNNWHLFVVLIDAVLAALDPQHRFSSAARLQRVAGFRRANGCFSDGPTGAVDYYNAWGFHYLLFWLHEIDETAYGELARQTLPDFCDWYRWLFTRDGSLPLFGRSLCYRFATPLPLLCAARLQPRSMPEALMVYQRVWQFFGAAGGLRAGRPTQGVFGEQLRWLDPYSGPASSFWGTRSLLLYLYLAPTVAPSALPAGPCQLHIEGLDAELDVDATRKQVRLRFAPRAATAVAKRGWRDRLREAIYAVASRPANNLRAQGERDFDASLSPYR